MKLSMTTKDKLNKISGIISLGLFIMIMLRYVIENESLLGFPNAMLLYVLMPLTLIWFGTRKNGCGSCNQTYDISKAEHDKNNL